MKGKDGKTLEESWKERFAELDAVVKITKQNRQELKEMSRVLSANYQKFGIIKYDAFNEMGGKLSFSLALLNEANDGFVLNAVHSREGCYTYVKDIIAGNSVILLSPEEKEALEIAKNS